MPQTRTKITGETRRENDPVTDGQGETYSALPTSYSKNKQPPQNTPVVRILDFRPSDGRVFIIPRRPRSQAFVRCRRTSTPLEYYAVVGENGRKEWNEWKEYKQDQNKAGGKRKKTVRNGRPAGMRSADTKTCARPVRSRNAALIPIRDMRWADAGTTQPSRSCAARPTGARR